MSVSNFRTMRAMPPPLTLLRPYRGDAVLSAAVYVPGQAQFAQADFVEAASSTVLGWVRSGVSQLAGSRFASVGDSILSFLGIPTRALRRKSSRRSARLSPRWPRSATALIPSTAIS